MKTNPFYPSAALLCICLTSGFCQPVWETVDDFQMSGHYTWPVDLAVGPSGAVYVLGFDATQSTGSDLRYLIRRSLDGGATWTSMGGFPHSVQGGTGYQALAVDSEGRLFLVYSTGTTYHEGPDAFHWVVILSCFQDECKYPRPRCDAVHTLSVPCQSMKT